MAGVFDSFGPGGPPMLPAAPAGPGMTTPDPRLLAASPGVVTDPNAASLPDPAAFTPPPPPPAPVYVPPRMMTTGGTTATTTESPIHNLPQLAERRAALAQQAQGALGEQAAAQEQANLAQVSARERTMRKLDELDVKYQKEADKAAGQLAKVRTKYEKELQEASNDKVDPGRALKTPGGITGAVLMIAGQAMRNIAQGMSGQQMTMDASRMLNLIIDRDIALQEREISRRKGKRAETLNLVDFYQRKLGDVGKAKDAARNAIMFRAGEELALAAQKSQNPLLRAKLAEQKMLVDQKLLDQQNIDFRAAQAKKVTRTSRTRGLVGGGMVDPQTGLPAGKSAKKPPPDKIVNDIGGLEDSERAVKRFAALLDKASRAEIMAGTGLGEVVNQQSRQLSVALARAAQPGPLTDTDVEPYSFSTRWTSKATMRKMIKESLRKIKIRKAAAIRRASHKYDMSAYGKAPAGGVGARPQ